MTIITCRCDLPPGKDTCTQLPSLIINVMKTPCFNDLPLALKADLIHDLGRLVLSIEHYDYRIDLYDIDGLLVEQYENIDKRLIEKITLATYHDLDKYLSRIVIGSLKKGLKDTWEN
jgi:hypothetical protein